jgi:hypothetical protein
MQVVAFPRNLPKGDFAFAEDLVHAGDRGLPSGTVLDRLSQVVANHLIQGRIALQRHLASRTQQIPIQRQRQVLLHRSSVAQFMCPMAPVAAAPQFNASWPAVGTNRLADG